MFSMKILTVSALVCAMMVLTGATHQKKQQVIVPGQIIDWSKYCKHGGGWTVINGHYFRFVARLLTWAQAEKNCQALGGNLASVHSVREYNGIKQMISDLTGGSAKTWLGGSDCQEEGVWLWSDGKSFKYTNWCKGEPNNRNKQHCLQMNFGVHKCWDDVQCNQRLPSVCLRKK